MIYFLSIPFRAFRVLGGGQGFSKKNSPTLPFSSIPSHLRHTACASRLSHHSSNHLIFVVKKRRDWEQKWERERDRDEDELSELLDFELEFKVSLLRWMGPGGVGFLSVKVDSG